MGQNCSRKRTQVQLSEDDWETPDFDYFQPGSRKPENDLTIEIDQLEEHMKAQRDVLALLESQMSLLIRDEEILKQSISKRENEVNDDDEKRRSKLRRKRRRNLTYYRSNELLMC